MIVALGGDGFMLQTLHAYLGENKPIYGMNRGTIGFLMNEYGEDNLLRRLRAAEPTIIHPLRMTAIGRNGKRIEALAFNEVSLLRETRQAAKIRIMIDERGPPERAHLRRHPDFDTRPAPPPTTSRRTGRSSRSIPPCWR